MAVIPVNPKATLPLTYTDLVCVDDLDPLAVETTSDLQNLEQDVRHVIQETLGSNLDDLSKGIGVGSRLSGSTVDLTRIPKILDGQLKKDPRVSTSKSTTKVNAGGSFELDVEVTVAGVVIGLHFPSSAFNVLP